MTSLRLQHLVRTFSGHSSKGNLVFAKIFPPDDFSATECGFCCSITIGEVTDLHGYNNSVLFETEHTWEFLLAPNNKDLFCIKKSETESCATELHILNADANYQQFRWQSGINLHETGQNFQFAVAHNRDLFAIKKSQTGSNSTEVHILTACSGYQTYRLQTGTALHETDHTFQFLLASNNDLYCIKKLNTGSNTTEVHVLSASSNYQSFVLQTGTCLLETDLSWDFIGVGWNNDVYAIRRSNTSLDHPRLYILNRASAYKTLFVHDIQPLPKANHKFAFALGRNSDLFVIQKTSTSSGYTDLQILSASSKYRDVKSLCSTRLQETDSTCEYLCANDDQDLIVVKRNHNGNGGTTTLFTFAGNGAGLTVLTDRFSTALHETNHTFDFAMAKNGDLFAIKKSNTRSGTELHILDASTRYTTFKVQTGTPLPQTDHTWKFLVDGNRDLVALRKSNTRSQRTEVFALTAASNYQSFRLQGWSTILEETNDAWDFVIAPNNDLIAIHKFNTRSGHTEVSILSSKSDYHKFALRDHVTMLPETDYNMAFVLTPDLQLQPIRKSQFPFSRNVA